MRACPWRKGSDADFGLRRGFTLIELLVVIAVIAILAAMLLPALLRAKDQAHSVRCKSNLHQMAVALHGYVEDSKVYPLDGLDIETTDRIIDITWADFLYPYYPLRWTNTAYHCPAYKGAITLPVQGFFGSYGYNVAGVVVGNVFIPGGEPPLGLGYSEIRIAPLPPVPVKDSAVLVPSQLLAFGDSKIWVLSGWYDEFGHGRAGSSELRSGLFEAWPAQIYPLRHGKNYNVAFCDAHVEGVRPTTLFNPRKTAVLWNTDHQPHPEVWR